MDLYVTEHIHSQSALGCVCIGNRVREVERKRKRKETEQTKDTIMSEQFI